MPTFLEYSELPLLVPPPRPDQRAQQQKQLTYMSHQMSFPVLVATLVESITEWREMPEGPDRDSARRVATIFTVDELFAWTAQMVANVIDNPIGLKDLPKGTKKKDLPKLLADRKIRARAKCEVEAGPFKYTFDCPDPDEIADFFDGEEHEIDCVPIVWDFGICYYIEECTIEWCSWYGVCLDAGTVVKHIPIEGCSPS